MLFPEGTRSLDGEMKSFKHGAFTLAKELGLEVVPIVIDGTRDALPKQGLLLRQTTPLQIAVRVLAPVSPDAVARSRARRLKPARGPGRCSPRPCYWLRCLRT